MTRLTFVEGSHRYWLDRKGGKGGTPLVSVTTLLGQLDKPALKRWAAQTAADFAADHWDELAALTPTARAKQIAAAPWQDRDRAAASGTAIHAMAEQMLAGQAVEVPAELVGKVEAVARWLERNDVAGALSEARVWSEPDDDMGLVGYAGTADLMATHARYGRLLLDWKTGKGVWPEMAVQLAGYADADWVVVDGDDMRLGPIDTWAIAHVTPAGLDLHVVDAESKRLASARFELLRMLRAVDEPSLRMEVA